MTHWSVERKIAAGCLAAMVVLIALGVLSYHEMADLIEADRWVSHTHEVLTGLADISVAVTRAESAQRGYLISHETSFLDGYAAGVASTHERIEYIARLTADNPVEVKNLAQLRPMVQARLNVLRSNLQLAQRSGFAAVQASIAQGRGEAKMAEIRDLVLRMQGVERQLLAQRQARSRWAARATFFLFTLAALLELSLLAVVYHLMNRDLNVRRQAETEQRQIAEQLRRSGEQLQRSNRELQDFASVASHDLQEPLRKIQAFGDRLRAKCAPSMNADGLDYLARMQNAAGRMQTLINDLLAFSRVTTKAQPFIRVNLEQVVREVLIDLEVRIEQLKGRVEVGSLPVIQADPLQMRQLMQNLVGNALKFHKPEQPPVVRIHQTAHRTDANGRQWVDVSVEDNGIGFDVKYLDRIFTVFQRLHGRAEYEGTGVGLAVCRKIAQRHGGDVTATSTPGQGSTFVVTLPMNPLAGEGGADASEAHAESELSGSNEAAPVAVDAPAALSGSRS